MRHWYGGAVGLIGFDGSLNTGLTLRTVRVLRGVAEVRVGATLLHDSDPASEEKETELKAEAMLDAIGRPDTPPPSTSAPPLLANNRCKSVLLIDHEDSFVHTLANYLRQTGAEVTTIRSGPPLLQHLRNTSPPPDLVVLSPGPGSPSDFKLSDTIDVLINRCIPIFGVCLGLQGIVEHFGGHLGVLDYPMHGKPSIIRRHFRDEAAEGRLDTDVLRDLPGEFQVARYHSLHGKKGPSFPAELIITAESNDGVVMALQHRKWPIAAVQFHPESILTLPKHGMKILTNALEQLTSDGYLEKEIKDSI